MTEFISIRGARENNLKDVTLQIPKRKLTIFTGVSGSGKSSIVFDTLATEAQRQLYENFSLFIRNFLPKYPQPDADDRKSHYGGHRRPEAARRRIAFHRRHGDRHPWRAAPAVLARGQTVGGRGDRLFVQRSARRVSRVCWPREKVGVVSDDFLDLSKSLNEGAVQVPFFGEWEAQAYTLSGFFDNDKKLSKFTKGEMELLLHGKDRKFKAKFGERTINLTYAGIIERIERSYIRRDIKTLSERTQKAVMPYLKPRECPSCKGARLSPAALASKINGHNIADLSSLEVGELLKVMPAIKDPKAGPIVHALVERLQAVVDIGLEYLSLNRETDTLSGGESQRVRMAKHLGSSLVDVMYIFDEPSVGLHPRDVHRLNELLGKLRDKGNTVIVIEHDPAVIAAADHIVDVGPGAGSGGGTIVFEGTYKKLLKSDTLTGRHLMRTLPIKKDVRKPTGQLRIKNARANNLKNISVDIPKGVLTAVTGVAGSGKSSLINEVFLVQHPNAIVIDQSAVGTSTRSNPATYTGVMDDLRKAFASANKVDAGLFSFNSKGACEACNGSGVVYTDLAFLDAFKSPCEVCQGRRFKDDVLAYKLDGKSISDVLAMTVAQAVELFRKRKEIVRKLQAMHDVGLAYLTLGQPLSTLSGGECQRIKLASELHKDGSVYVMDEPTTGLHMSDIAHLLGIIDRLVDGGNTVIVIEHNLDVIRGADWIIDMGPEGGNKGGRVIFEGAPQQLLDCEQSLTSAYLRK
ncbi:MAG TPA: excinuclease ABC subunit UvrA [Bryobacteraceae bacterium]|jgi:excinuclease UvrABC ATPase subunit|nr:excinuclease ABC subunit UvrA [Bryobacteraceae bacterium]